MSHTLTAAPLSPAVATRALQVRLVTAPARVGLTLELGPTRHTLGRTDDATVVLHDPRASRLHAALAPLEDGEHTELVDLGSRNGCHLDGRAVRRATLLAGQVMRLGDGLWVVEEVPPAGASEHAELRGRSAAMARLRAELARVAPTGLTVVLQGETGTGKELAARDLHAQSGRAGELVPVNCAAIPAELVESVLFGHRRGAFTGATEDAPGLFRQAHTGTLFLDEVAELPLDAQAKLLRVLEDGQVTPVGGRRTRSVDVRVVAASHVDLREAVDRQAFRGDLYARLEEWPVHLPPLRQRRGDIVDLALAFLAEDAGSAAPPSLSADAAEALLLHDWPFNVRELRKLCRRLALLCPDGQAVTLDHLPEPIAANLRNRRSEAPPVAEPTEREALEAALRTCGGSVVRAARHLGVSRRTLYRRLASEGLDPDDFRNLSHSS